MAILGGAGNPVGGSFTGPAEALEIVGNHCMAYSGIIVVSNTTVEALKFTTGNYYSKIKLFIHYNSLNFSATHRIGYIVNLNGTDVVEAIYGDLQPGPTNPYDVELIIPAYTDVIVSLHTSDPSNIDMDCTIAGRIYRD